MLMRIPGGPSAIQTHVTNTTDETATMAITVTASGTANAVGSYTELIATTSYESVGVMVQLAGLSTTASANQRCLVNISVGSAGNEVVLIPNLTCGNTAAIGAVAGGVGGAMYYFPIYVPSGVRIAANAQASTGTDTVNVAVRMFQQPIGPTSWVGSRVTAYGADTANSRGTSHTPDVSANGYKAATQLTASTTYPIRYMQLGYDLLSATTGSTSNYLARIGYGATPTYLVSELPIQESTTIESTGFVSANFILSQMRFNLAAEQSLHISAMRTASSPAARGWIVYGVD